MRPAAASTAGRLKRREPEVGGPGATASTTRCCSSASWSSLPSPWARSPRSLRLNGPHASALISPAGVSVVYTAEGKNISTADLNETVNILNLRVNGLGVSGAQVQTTGNNQISVQIPGVKNAQQVLDQIGQTARLYFRPVECYAYPEAVQSTTKTAAPAAGHREDAGLHVVDADHDVQPAA